MNLNILRKHNDLPGAKRVLFVPINTLMTDYYRAFTDNNFELYSLNFEGKDGNKPWNSAEYLKLVPKMDQIFLKACSDLEPDWVFVKIDQLWISPSAIKSAKEMLPNAIFTNWTGDVRQHPKPGVVEIGKVVDITLIVSVGQIDLYKSYGLNRVEFLQTGVNVDKFCRFPDTKREELRKRLNHDIVFCANNSGAFPGALLRQKVTADLCKTFGKNFALYGGGWNKPAYKSSFRKRIPYNEQNTVYNGSKIVISINNFNDLEMYFSARQLNGMAAGTLTVSKYIPGLEKFFDNGKDLVWFNSSKECLDLVKYYLNHNDEAEQIGINGSKKVLEFHTKKARIKEMKDRLGF